MDITETLSFDGREMEKSAVPVKLYLDVKVIGSSFLAVTSVVDQLLTAGNHQLTSISSGHDRHCRANINDIAIAKSGCPEMAF